MCYFRSKPDCLKFFSLVGQEKDRVPHCCGCQRKALTQSEWWTVSHFILTIHEAFLTLLPLVTTVQLPLAVIDLHFGIYAYAK